MKTLKVKTDYGRLSDDELSTLAGKVKQFMTNNANYTVTVPPLTDHETDTDDFVAKLEISSKGGSIREVALKNEARKKLLKTMRRLAFHVNNTANGDEAALVSSGFVLVAADRNIQAPGVPQWIRLTDHHQNGYLRFDFQPQRDVWEYEYTVSTETDDNGLPMWGPMETTTRSRMNLITPVTTGVVYRVRVRARNRKGRGDWSETASLMAR